MKDSSNQLQELLLLHQFFLRLGRLVAGDTSFVDRRRLRRVKKNRRVGPAKKYMANLVIHPLPIKPANLLPLPVNLGKD